MKIFITGFDGYVGQHAVAALLKRGARLTALCRNNVTAEGAEKRGLLVAKAPLDDPSALAEAVRGHDAVGHFAASEAPAFLKVNRAAIEAMVDALPKDGTFLMQGGSSVFGDQGKERPAERPIFNPPAALRGRAALDAWVLQGSERRRIYIAYGSLVFGGAGAMIPRALLSATAASNISAYPGDGSNIWSAVHVTDWADLMARAMFDGPTGPNAIFAAAEDVSIAILADLVGRALSPSRPARSVCIDEARARYPFFAEALSVNQRYDNVWARDVLKWSPPKRNLLESLRETAQSLAL